MRGLTGLLVAAVLFASCGGPESSVDDSGRLLRDRVLGVTLVAPQDWTIRYGLDFFEVASANRDAVVSVISQAVPLSDAEFENLLGGLGVPEGVTVSAGVLGGRRGRTATFESDALPGGSGTVRAFTTDKAPALSLSSLLSDGASPTALDRVLGSLTLPAASGVAYGAWQRLSSLVETPLFEIVALDAQTILASGARGLILRSEDAGATWMEVKTETDRSIVSMDFDRRGAVGVAVGQDGLILRTADGGVSWGRVDSPTSQFLTGVAILPDGATVIAVGVFGTLLRSEDAGESWEAGSIESDESFNAVATVPDSADVLVVGRNVHLESPDAGRTWAVSAFSSALLDVAVVAGGFGIAASSGGLIPRTDTAGFAWSFVDFLDVAIFEGVAVAPDRQFFLVGTEGAIVSSVDAIATKFEDSGVGTLLRGAAYGPDGTRWAVGDDGVILRSTRIGS